MQCLVLLQNVMFQRATEHTVTQGICRHGVWRYGDVIGHRVCSADLRPGDCGTAVPSASSVHFIWPAIIIAA